MTKQKIKRVEVKISGKFEEDVTNYAKEFGYSHLQNLFKEAVREKIYGKDIKEQITNKFLDEVEKEKEYIFDEKKDLHEKLKNIANRF